MTIINVADAGSFSVTTMGDQTYNDQVLATNVTFNADNMTATVTSNDFMGTTSINLTTNGTIADANDFDFGPSTINGNLVLTADADNTNDDGDVTDSGPVVVDGLSLIHI